jgi:hypothetical protein
MQWRIGSYGTRARVAGTARIVWKYWFGISGDAPTYRNADCDAWIAQPPVPDVPQVPDVKVVK